MLARLDGQENISSGENTRHRVDTSRERLAEEDHIGLDGRVVLEAEELAGTGETLHTGPRVSSGRSKMQRLLLTV